MDILSHLERKSDQQWITWSLENEKIYFIGSFINHDEASMYLTALGDVGRKTIIQNSKVGIDLTDFRTEGAEKMDESMFAICVADGENTVCYRPGEKITEIDRTETPDIVEKDHPTTPAELLSGETKTKTEVEHLEEKKVEHLEEKEMTPKEIWLSIHDEYLNYRQRIERLLDKFDDYIDKKSEPFSLKNILSDLDEKSAVLIRKIYDEEYPIQKGE